MPRKAKGKKLGGKLEVCHVNILTPWLARRFFCAVIRQR